MPAKKFNLSDYPKHIQDLCKHPEPDHLPSEPREWIDYRTLFSVTEADIPMLWEIASFIDKMNDDDSGEFYYAPSHAWMALGQFDESSVPLSKLLEAINLIFWHMLNLPLMSFAMYLYDMGSMMSHNSSRHFKMKTGTMKHEL